MPSPASASRQKTHYETPDARCRVSLLDYGTSAEHARRAANAAAATVTVYPQDDAGRGHPRRPAGRRAARRRAGRPQNQPAAHRDGARALRAKSPLFAVGLGHELLALAAGGDTFKLHYGHRGASLPVTEQASGRTVVTSQNHGYAVAADSIPRAGRQNQLPQRQRRHLRRA